MNTHHDFDQSDNRIILWTLLFLMVIAAFAYTGYAYQQQAIRANIVTVFDIDQTDTN